MKMVTLWRATSQLVMAIESEKAASSRCGERMRIFRCGSETASSILRGDGCGAVISGLGPVGNERVDDDVTDAVCRVERRKIGAVLADFGLGKTFGSGGTDALLIVIGCSAQDEDAADVELVGFRQPGE